MRYDIPLYSTTFETGREADLGQSADTGSLHPARQNESLTGGCVTRSCHVAMMVAMALIVSTPAWANHTPSLNLLSHLHQPLLARVALRSGEQVESRCFQSSVTLLDGTPLANVKVEPVAGNGAAAIQLTTRESIDEPVVNVKLANSCSAREEYEYQELLEPAPLLAASKRGPAVSNAKQEERNQVTENVNEAGGMQLAMSWTLSKLTTFARNAVAGTGNDGLLAQVIGAKSSQDDTQATASTPWQLATDSMPKGRDLASGEKTPIDAVALRDASLDYAQVFFTICAIATVALLIRDWRRSAQRMAANRRYRQSRARSTYGSPARIEPMAASLDLSQPIPYKKPDFKQPAAALPAPSGLSGAAPAAAERPRATEAEGRLPVCAATEVSDAAQLITFWTEINRPERAIELVLSKWGTEGPATIGPWLYLLDLYQLTGDDEKYRHIAEQFERKFKRQVTPMAGLKELAATRFHQDETLKAA
jgi:hypothetical protein